jgi:Mce-associated membrane protein
MADDAATPDRELSESNADEPELLATEITDIAESEDFEESEDSTDESGSDSGTIPKEKRRRSHVQLALIAGIIVVLALGGLSGWLGYRAYHSYQADKQRQLFLQVARQGALNLTTIDWQRADADVQRVLDGATGDFYDDFEQRAQPFTEVVKQAQSKTTGSITEAGIVPGSLAGDEGQVLVAVKVEYANATTPQQQPRLWRMKLTVREVGGEAKVSKVDFVS